MKKITLLTLMSLLCVIIFAQAPEKFNYQSVIRDGNGEILANQNVAIRISLLEDSDTGTEIYKETHSVTTNTQGLVNLVIGEGTAENGSMAACDWGAHNYYIMVELDETGSAGYTDMGTAQLLSVPYALFAASAPGGAGTTYTGGSGITITGTSIAADDASATNEIQTISKTGSTVTLSDGGGTFTDDNTEYSAGTGISISGTTITNSAPDQTVSLSGTGATSVSGTYPNFTISSTNTEYSAGTGIGISGTTISNSAPDQTVSLSGTGATSVSGTYPNFTISSTDANTTYTGGSGIDVTGTTISASPTITLTASGLLGVGDNTITKSIYSYYAARFNTSNSALSHPISIPVTVPELFFAQALRVSSVSVRYFVSGSTTSIINSYVRMGSTSNVAYLATDQNSTSWATFNIDPGSPTTISAPLVVTLEVDFNSTTDYIYIQEVTIVLAP